MKKKRYADEQIAYALRPPRRSRRYAASSGLTCGARSTRRAVIAVEHSDGARSQVRESTVQKTPLETAWGAEGR